MLVLIINLLYLNDQKYACKEGSLLANSSIDALSKNLAMLTSSNSPFLRRVLTMNSLANDGTGLGSKGLRTIDLSKGSPGTTFQCENYDSTIAYPTVCVLRSVSNPNDSIAGISTLSV